MKIEINEFINEVKEEIMCYEELGEKCDIEWEKEFYKWLEKSKNNKSIIIEKNRRYFLIKDESEIFEIADSYYDAVESKCVNVYWKNFK